MSEIEEINERIRKAVRAISSCFPTALEAARNLQAGMEQMQKLFPVPDEPELIQGYTAENWQEIIDGGYLCEYSQNGIHWSKAKWPLEKFHELKGGLFEGDMEKRSFCRPAQIKGVMRPIFVEPVDKNAWCHFFMGSDRIRFGGWSDSSDLASSSGATKYIEL